MRRNRVGVEIRVAATVRRRRCRAGAATRCGSRARRRRTGRRPAHVRRCGRSTPSRLRGAAHRFTPVADDLDAVLDATNLVPIGQAADVRTRALVHRDDAEGGRGIQRGQLGPRAAVRVSARHGRPPRTRWCASLVNGCWASEPVRVGQTRARAGATRSRPLPSGRRPGPGTRACHRRQRRRRRCWGRGVRASRIRPSRVPRSGRRDGRGRSRREAAGSAAAKWPGRRSSPARVSPVAVRWTWLSTKAGATKAPSRSTTCASGNWRAPRRRCRAMRRRRRVPPLRSRRAWRGCAPGR